MHRKVSVIGGGGVRTPLLIHGLLQAQSLLEISELQLFDVDSHRAELMALLGREIANNLGVDVKLWAVNSIDAAVEGCDFVLSSLRIGGMAARARDERIAIEEGLAGQETTGPGGVAMALRTVPVALAYARIVERLAPKGWFINFTNPAGLITQALNQHTKLKLVGICDTPAELLHRVAHVLGEPSSEVRCDYAGLNHLGWVRRVFVRGEDVTAKLLNNEQALRKLYHADLFDPLLIRTLNLIPSEYLFFYYSQRKAFRNQYHRIAVEVICGLVSDLPREVVVNVRNESSIEDLPPEDVVEVPCTINKEGVKPMHAGRLPESVRGLVLAVKAYERTAIRAVIEKSWPVAQLAMLEYPIIGQWEIAQNLRNAWAGCDQEHLGYLEN